MNTLINLTNFKDKNGLNTIGAKENSYSYLDSKSTMLYFNGIIDGVLTLNFGDQELKLNTHWKQLKKLMLK
jgi:hypothetical protein